ncbi:aminotransferase class I/II-fold pyridoxal phosphate-dependent enzyme, partial [bacterium]|nr:aminotransferase class I/II-fold pyridoxal phosphate-dependent enzyme [bacterium]
MSENKETHSLGFHTRAAKNYVDGKKAHRPLSTPIMQGTIFQMESSESLGELFRTKADTVYTRFGNPTLSAAAEKMATLEGAEAALVFSSGMGAITTSLLAVLRSGDHVVAQRNIFAQTFTFLNIFARSLGIETDFVDATNMEELEQAVRPTTVLLYIETPSNPLLEIVDIHAIARMTQAKGILLFVDSTFATPFLQNPLVLGANLVLHSGSKYIGGHADLLCGVAAGNSSLIQTIRNAQTLLGNILDPHAAWVLLRGIKTLGVRIERQCENALELARFLGSQENVIQVNYPWLESSPFCQLARRQMTGGGGMLSFMVSGGLASARA